MLTQAFRNLHDAGIVILFAANAASLRDSRFPQRPDQVEPRGLFREEVGLLQRQRRGCRLAALAERSSLSDEARSLFSQAGTLLIEKDPCALTRTEALDAAAQLHAALQLPLKLP